MKRKDARQTEKNSLGSTLERQLERRSFLKGAAVLLASARLASTAQAEEPPPAPEPPAALLNPNVPERPEQAPPPGTFYVFSAHEAATVEALTARLIPGTPDDPGAREAGVVSYIDGFLAYHEGFPEPTYRQPPYAMTYEGDAPPTDTVLAADYQALWVPADQIKRYGYQSILNPREVYRIGVAAVDRSSRDAFGKSFVSLTEEQQDSIIQAMADGTASGFDTTLTSQSFFHNLRRHTVEGLFSDPAYGGNRNMVGWKLVGYPGAQRSYTPREIRNEGTNREPQSNAQMHAFNPGRRANPYVTLPVSGEEMQHRP